MSRHIDLVAVAALVLAFVLAARVHDSLRTGMWQGRLFRIHRMTPVIVAPRVPVAPRLPRLPNV